MIVNFKSTNSEAMQGVLWQSRGPWLTLKQCSALRAGHPPQAMDGDVVIHRSNIAFLQALP